MAKYLKSPLLNYDVLATAARQPGIYSLGRRASSYSRVQHTYRDDACRHDSSQGVKEDLGNMQHQPRAWNQQTEAYTY